MDSERIRRWQRISQLALDSEQLRDLRALIRAICEAPGDLAARERLRTAVESGALHAQLVALLAVEGRGVRERAVLEALREEANLACAHIERPRDRLSVLEARVKREPDRIDHREHLAWVYYLVGAWAQAAHELDELVRYAPAEDLLLLLRAAGRLYRNSGRIADATGCYRAIAIRKPGDIDALIALGELLAVVPADGPNPFDPSTEPATEAAPPLPPPPAVPSLPPKQQKPTTLPGAPSPRMPAPAPPPPPALPSLRQQPASPAPAPLPPPELPSLRQQPPPPSPSSRPSPPPSASVPSLPSLRPPQSPAPSVEESRGSKPSLFATLDEAELDASIDFALGVVTPPPRSLAELATDIELDSIPDAVNTGEHEVPNVDFEDDDIPVHLRRQR